MTSGCFPCNEVTSTVSRSPLSNTFTSLFSVIKSKVLKPIQKSRTSDIKGWLNVAQMGLASLQLPEVKAPYEHMPVMLFKMVSTDLCDGIETYYQNYDQTEHKDAVKYLSNALCRLCMVVKGDMTCIEESNRKYMDVASVEEHLKTIQFPDAMIQNLYDCDDMWVDADDIWITLDAVRNELLMLKCTLKDRRMTYLHDVPHQMLMCEATDGLAWIHKIIDTMPWEDMDGAISEWEVSTLKAISTELKARVKMIRDVAQHLKA